jgi:UDP-N-acetylglucosamine--N-acetylmuramyl-(pentapeptide) pyrophosphoryl-undecaprenol N-acetylglucosamine transferase
MGTPLRVVIAGGGTGGHLYPGIAVARELLARRPGTQISFAGTAQGLEARVLPRAGFALDLIRSVGIKGKSIVDRARGAWLVPASLWDAWRVVSERRPHLVIGVVATAPGPVVLLAALRGLPRWCRANAVPGLTMPALAVRRSAAVTFDSTREYFGGKAFVSGNPVRPGSSSRSALWQRQALMTTHRLPVLNFWRLSGRARDQRAMVGSGGMAADSRIITHQTGERDVESARSLPAQNFRPKSSRSCTAWDGGFDKRT